MNLRQHTGARMGRIIAWALAAVLAVLIWFWPSHPDPLTEKESMQIVESLARYLEDLQKRGQALPKRLSLGDLVRAGYGDMGRVGGMNLDRVWIWLDGADESQGQAILLHALHSDGTYSIGLSDGSAHWVNAGQWSAFLKALADRNKPAEVK